MGAASSSGKQCFGAKTKNILPNFDQSTSTEQALVNIEGQLDTIKKRTKVTETKISDLTASAINKKKAGDQRGAIRDLKQLKLQKSELGKLDGQMTQLEEQKILIQSTNSDIDVVKSMRTGVATIRSIQDTHNVGVEAIQELHDEIQENLDDMKERNDFFVSALEDDKDKLLAELNDLEESVQDAQEDKE